MLINDEDANIQAYREDQSYKEILGTLNQVSERLDDDKIVLRKYKLETEAEESVKKIREFRDILLQEPSSYLRREKSRTLLICMISFTRGGYHNTAH